MSKNNKKNTPIIVANWKMNGLLSEGKQLVKEISSYLNEKETEIKSDVVICPPYSLLHSLFDDIKNTKLKLGAQNCHHLPEGAYTGEISARQVKDANCDFVILGHSERRTTINEGSEVVCKKSEIAHSNELTTIICVGETLYERDNDLVKIVIREQILHSVPKSASSHNTIIAYEPIWAIGTGTTPTLEQIDEMHKYISEVIDAELPQFESVPRILYGGSIKSANSESILSIDSVDGLLVGKASLNSGEFIKIIDNS